MSFFKCVADWAQQAIGNADSFLVTEVALPTVRKWDCLTNENIFTLYKDRSAFKAVLSANGPSPKFFLVFKISNQEKAGLTFNALSYKLQVLASSCASLNIELVQKMSDAIMKYPSYGCAHIASHLGLCNILAKENIAMSINEAEESSGKTPLHISVENERIDCIQELLFLNVRHNCIDIKGNTAFHYAARCTDSNILKVLASKDSSFVNQTNHAGETALHEACLSDRPENVEMLLRWKADPTLTKSHRQPVHCAVAVGSKRCIETLNKWNVDILDAKEDLFGNSVLHIADGKEMMHFLVELGCSMEEVNLKKETPLLLKIKEGNLPSAVGLLTVGANASARDEDGNGALHLAIQQDRADLVQLLIVFGADINLCNNFQISPRHEAACSSGKNSDEILNLLHMVGAVRCSELKSNCSQGCKFDGSFDGSLNGTSKTNSSPRHAIQSVVDQFFEKSAVNAALSRSESLYKFEDTERHRQKPGSRVLCLDGGGIRGMVTVKILMAIEHITGRPICDSFDWIGGTSTGGILTMGLLQGKRLNQIMGAYFRLKDEVFQGKRPYNSESLEKFLKKELGEWTRMTDVQRPRVMLMTVLADRLPAELFVFKNYNLPGVEHNSLPSPFKEFQPIPRPQDQLVWQAVRATGAAPTYFRASGRFIDGGLIANNPTLDVLSEIHKFNTANKAAGTDAKVEPMHVVVSIGTGKAPQRFVKECDVFRPEGILDYTKAFWGAKNFGDLVIDQVTQSDGQSVNRAAAWCNMIDVPYYRLNPQLSEDIPLDCTDDSKLINMLWETQCYLQNNHEKLIQLANLLD